VLVRVCVTAWERRAWRLDGDGSRVLVREAAWGRLACAGARACRLEGEGSHVLVLTILLEGCLLVRGAHTLVAAYVQDISVACTRTAKARCASTTFKLQWGTSTRRGYKRMSFTMFTVINYKIFGKWVSPCRTEHKQRRIVYGEYIYISLRIYICPTLCTAI